MLLYVSPIELLTRMMEKTNSLLDSIAPESTVFYLSGYRGKGSHIDWYSPPYYTHTRGYKMCMGVYMRPKDTTLNVYSFLHAGEYDGGLKWPFRGMVVIQLINQLSDGNHYEYVFDYSQAGDAESQRVTRGIRSMFLLPSNPHLPLTDLNYRPSNNTLYLKNSCLKFRIVVQNKERFL